MSIKGVKMCKRKKYQDNFCGFDSRLRSDYSTVVGEIRNIPGNFWEHVVVHDQVEERRNSETVC